MVIGYRVCLGSRWKVVNEVNDALYLMSWGFFEWDLTDVVSLDTNGGTTICKDKVQLK